MEHSARQRLQAAVDAHRRRDIAMAVSICEEVLRDEPNNADALHLLGLARIEAGQVNPGLANLKYCLAQYPDLPKLHFNYATALHQVGRYPQALAEYDLAIARQPDDARLHFNRANCLQMFDAHAESIASYGAAIAAKSDYAAAYLNRGVLHQKRGRFDVAIEDFRRAIACRSSYSRAYSNLGNALRVIGQWEEAQHACEEAVRLAPHNVECLTNLANVLQDRHRFAEALDCYARAIAVKPDHVTAQWSRALLLLRLGDEAAGWKAYEWRKRLSPPVALRHYAVPEWRGEDLSGRRIFIHAEQGLGDVLQFCRFVPLVQDLGAQVVCAVPEPLVRLVRTMDHRIQVISFHAVPEDFDLHCPLMSLPWLLQRGGATAPRPPYFHPDLEKTARWTQRLAALPGLKVGLVWAGAPRPEDAESDAIDRRRSVPMALFAPLANVAGVSLLSLQKGPAAAQARSLPEGMTLHDWTDELTDFHDTGCLASALDLVISVDTSVVHLAGGLAKETWVLNRYDQCWRWMADRVDSPWYPSARLFRQPSPGDWDSVIQSVMEALRARVA